MTMKSIHDAYLENRERNIQSNAVLKKRLSEALFAGKASQKLFSWHWRLLTPLAIGIAALALIVVQNGRTPIHFGGSDTDSMVAGGGMGGATPRELQNFVCLEGCGDRVKVIDSRLPGEVYFDSGDCDVCNEIVLWANYMDAARIHIAGFAIIDGYQRSIPSQIIGSEQINDVFTLPVPSWNGSGWDSEHPVKTLRVSLKETGEWNLVDDIQCDGGCDGYNILTDRGGLYVVIHEQCPIDPCDVYELYQYPSAGPANGYQVAFHLASPVADLVAVPEFSRQYTSQELAENPVLHVTTTLNDIVCEFDLVE